MPRVEHRTNASIGGVFNIDKPSLEELDEVVNEARKRLRKLRQQDISKKQNDARIEAEKEYAYLEDEALRTKWIEERVERAGDRYPLSQNKIEWCWNFKDGQKLNTATIREAIDHAVVQNHQVEKFSLSLECGRYDCKIDMSNWMGMSIDIRVSPSHLIESSRIFSELESWAKERRLPKLFYWWSFLRPGFITLCLYWILLVSIILAIFAFKDQGKESNDTNDLRNAAESLLTQGITVDNEHQAIELLLEMQLHGVPPKQLTEKSHHQGLFTRSNTFIFMMLPLWIVLCFPPSTIIGIGESADKLKRSQLWIKILFVLLPTFLLMGILPSILGSLIYDFLGF